MAMTLFVMSPSLKAETFSGPVIGMSGNDFVPNLISDAECKIAQAIEN